MRSQTSAYPYSLYGSNANAVNTWYEDKGRRLKSALIADDQDLRNKLRDIEESKPSVVRLYVIGLPVKAFGTNNVEEGKLLVCLIVIHFR